MEDHTTNLTKSSKDMEKKLIVANKSLVNDQKNGRWTGYCKGIRSGDEWTGTDFE